MPQSISMVCGSVHAELKEPTDMNKQPTGKLTFSVLTMDKNGHITWPTNYDPKTRAQLRNQARALLQKMIEDPLNPVDETMAPALTGMGSSALWAGAPKRKLVEVSMEAA